MAKVRAWAAGFPQVPGVDGSRERCYDEDPIVELRRIVDEWNAPAAPVVEWAST